MKQQPIVFVDVDDTLVRSIGTKRIPMPAVVDRVKSLYDEGAHSIFGAVEALNTQGTPQKS